MHGISKIALARSHTLLYDPTGGAPAELHPGFKKASNFGR